ncbi:myelin protein zero-like protein 3 [Aplochiton taeniatus]
MVRIQTRSSSLNVVLLLYLVVWFVPAPGGSVVVSSPAELRAVQGDTVTLPCSFTSTSRASSRMTVDWAYRPQSGGNPLTFFHFSSKAYLPTEGQFRGRIRWQGSPARGEASLVLVNASLSDNGTFTCTIRNPPDVHGSPTSHTVLTVTPKGASMRFSDVAMLLAFILLPSAIISLVLIGRMFCGPVKENSQLKYYRSPIEDIDREDLKQQHVEAKTTCCKMYLEDDYDEVYTHKQVPEEEGIAESQC